MKATRDFVVVFKELVAVSVGANEDTPLGIVNVVHLLKCAGGTGLDNVADST